MISGKYDPVGFGDSYPASGFEGLCRLVDKKGGKCFPVQYLVRGTYQSAGYHAGFPEELGVDFDFQFNGLVTQAI